MRGGFVTAVPQPWELEAFPAPDHTQRQVWQAPNGWWWYRTRCCEGRCVKAYPAASQGLALVSWSVAQKAWAA